MMNVWYADPEPSDGDRDTGGDSLPTFGDDGSGSEITG